MVGRLWYEFLRAYVGFGLKFYFRKQTIVGKENLPHDKPIVFLANHQNAFLDAFFIVTGTAYSIYFLTRAEVFKGKFSRWILSSMKLIPVYRIRDGWDSLEKNAATFNQCYNAFQHNECIIMFPEGNHDQHRRLRPLSRGFTKICFGALERDNEMDLQIVPVGINYEHHVNYFKNASVHYGRPIEIKQYFTEANGANMLRDKVAEEIKKLMVHIEDKDRHDEIFANVVNSGADVCDPIAVNKLIAADQWPKEGEKKPTTRSATVTALLFPIIFLLKVLNFLPMLGWRAMRKKIKDPVMVASVKVAFGVFMFPTLYLVQAILVFLFTNGWVALAFFVVCIFSMPLKAILSGR